MEIVIIGAGPAGLTAAWELSKHKLNSTILESDSNVGGISRTVEQNGWRFDIGGHRFFTKVDEVYEIWSEMLDDEDFLFRSRLSRIYYDKKFFNYPLKISNVLLNLGLIEAIKCVFSYIHVRIFPITEIDNFEKWVASRFGWRLYNIFFKTYTEKVWGVSANLIGADWASQRIKDLTLSKAVLNALLPKKSDEVITTLIDSFRYPKFGPGMMWESAAKKLEEDGHKIVFDSKVSDILYENNSYKIKTTSGKTYIADAIFSSMPLSHLPSTINPHPPKEILKAGKELKFRDFLSVALVVPKNKAFPDNWIYIHDPEVRVGRVQNYGNWSPYMIKEDKTCLGLEYFVNEGDDLWTKDDNDLVKLAIKELDYLGLANKELVFEGYVVRMPKAYPVYDLNYKENINLIKDWLTKSHKMIFPIGRNGMHRYNNQDHSMMTAVKSVRNLILNEKNDIWNINVEEDYHEEHTVDRDSPTI